MSYRIVLLTSDHYIRAVLPYAWLLKKYWKPHPQVLVAGFSYPDFQLPDGFTFHSIGAFEDYPLEKWSDALIDLLAAIDDEIVLLSLEDMWIIQPVDACVVEMAYDYCRQFEYVARFDLTGDRLYAGNAKVYGKLGDVDLIWSDPDSPYHLSTMPAFWRKRHLEQVLIPSETPWQLELDGTPRLSDLRHEMIVLGCDAWPLKNTLAFRGGDTTELLLDELDQADVDIMRGLGYFEPWE